MLVLVKRQAKLLPKLFLNFVYEHDKHRRRRKLKKLVPTKFVPNLIF